MQELEENKVENSEKQEKMLDEQNNRESDIRLERVSDNLIENAQNENNESDSKKVSSFQTILSIWNTMIGSSIVSIPYNVYYAGIIPTIIIGLLYGFICYFTCSIVVKLGGKEEEFAKVVYNYFNYALGRSYAKVGRVLQITFNLMINIGATFVYFVIINQNLFPCLCFFLNKIFGLDIDEEDITPYFDQFSLFYCALIVSVCVFPLTILKEMGILVKFNSYGIYFVSSLLIFVIYSGIYTLAKDKLHFKYKENIKDKSVKDRNLFLFGENPGLLAGTLSLGLFCHSVILPLLKNNEKQENNKRDLFIGYLLVVITYLAFGILGYIGFSAKNFDGDFKDNWFRFFKGDNYFILILRLLNVFQLLSIFPVLNYIVRIQFFGIFFNNSFPSYLHIVIFSFILIILCFLILYFLYESLSSLISNIGAGTGLFLIFLIPIIVNIVYYKRKHPHNLTELQANLIMENDNESDIDKNLKNEIKDIDDFGISKKPKNQIKEIIFYTTQILIMIFGVFTFIIQFVNINFFNITIKDK